MKTKNTKKLLRDKKSKNKNEKKIVKIHLNLPLPHFPYCTV